jgi:ribonuclease BN (tRNA processing enzyme)
VRVTIIGCSGSYPGPDSPASCYLVEADDFRLVIDLGNGALGRLQRHVGLYEIGAVLLTHHHPDHCADLCSYYVARRYRPGGQPPPIPVYGPAGTAERMARAYGMPARPGMSGTFDFRTLQPGKFELGPFEVTVDRVNHPVETFGVRVADSTSAMAYSADTGETPALVDLARDADLLLAEASFVEGDDNPPGLHLTGRQAADHAARAHAGRLVLTHLVPWHDPKRVLGDAGESPYDGAVELAIAGATYDL